MLEDIILEVTTDGSGDGTDTSTRALFGLLYAVEWNDGDFVDGVDAVLSVVNRSTGVDYTLLTLTDANIDKIYYPRAIGQGTDGADQSINNLQIQEIVNGNLKLVVSSGGDTKTGGVTVYIDDLS